MKKTTKVKILIRIVNIIVFRPVFEIAESAIEMATNISSTKRL